MKKYRVGFKWKSGQEEYIVLESSKTSAELAEALKQSDTSGNLESVFVKPID